VKCHNITPGFVLRIIPYFCVPKGDEDIRVMWDLKMNGVNETIYTPKFQLPTPASYHHVLEASMYLGDFDVGKQFPNYPLHPAEHPFFGVKFSPELEEQFCQEGINNNTLIQWNCLPFGW